MHLSYAPFSFLLRLPFLLPSSTRLRSLNRRPGCFRWVVVKSACHSHLEFFVLRQPSVTILHPAPFWSAETRQRTDFPVWNYFTVDFGSLTNTIQTHTRIHAKRRSVNKKNKEYIAQSSIQYTNPFCHPPFLSPLCIRSYRVTTVQQPTMNNQRATGNTNDSLSDNGTVHTLHIAYLDRSHHGAVASTTKTEGGGGSVTNPLFTIFGFVTAGIPIYIYHFILHADLE